MKLPIGDIRVGSRHRKDMGDLSALAESIKHLGLLQPVGVTQDHTLIFGERRLRACRDILGLAEIEARIIDMPSIVVGEEAENTVRKDFTPSERVAIADAIEAEMAERRGRPATEEKGQEIAAFSEVARGQRTADFAAKKAGFGNRETYRQAKVVVEKAEPELVQAMDEGKVSVLAAYKVAKAEPEVQRDFAKQGGAWEDMQRREAAEHRQYAQGRPLAEKLQAITDAAAVLADSGLTPEEFKRAAPWPTYQRFQRSAVAAYAFLKPLVEVGNDQARAG